MTNLKRVCDFFEVAMPVTDGPWLLEHYGRADLCRLFQAFGFREGAEVGVWAGHFSQTICETVTGVHLRCIDPWQSYEAYHERKNDPTRLQNAHDQALERLRAFQCTFMRMTSLEAAAFVPDGSLDFVYIDGNHERPFIQADLETWTPKIRPGGILSGHDFHTIEKSPFIQVEAVVREFTRARGIAPWFVLGADKAPSYFWVVE